MKEWIFRCAKEFAVLVAIALMPGTTCLLRAEPLMYQHPMGDLQLLEARERIEAVQHKTGVSMVEAATAVLLTNAELNAKMCGFKLSQFHRDAKLNFIDRSKRHRAYKYAQKAKFPLGANRRGHCEETYREDRGSDIPFFKHPELYQHGR